MRGLPTRARSPRAASPQAELADDARGPLHLLAALACALSARSFVSAYPQRSRAIGKLVDASDLRSACWCSIDVDDLERGVRFYTEGLGLRIGRRFKER